jgi:hypothetical protein
MIVFYAISMYYTTYCDQIASDPPEDFVVGVLWLVAGSCRIFSEVNTKKIRRIIVTRPTIHVKLPRRVWVTEIISSSLRGWFQELMWPRNKPSIHQAAVKWPSVQPKLGKSDPNSIMFLGFLILSTPPINCILGSGNPGWVLGTQPKWVGPPNLADVLGRTKYPKPSLGSQWVPSQKGTCKARVSLPAPARSSAAEAY